MGHSEGDRRTVEQSILRNTLEEAWASTEAYWNERDINEVRKASQSPKHQMALVFRSYLGLSSRWAYTRYCRTKVGLSNLVWPSDGGHSIHGFVEVFGDT